MKRRKHASRLSFRILCMVLCAVGALAHAQTPLLQFNFNETGTSAVNTGSLSAPLSLVNSSGVASDLHSADALGVSGLPGDRAFDNTASTGMGSQGVGGVGLLAPHTLPSLSSFTLAVWIDVPVEIDYSARFVTVGNLSLEAAGIRTTTAGEIGLFVNSTAFPTEAISAIDYTLTNQWMFVAVTYDGTKTTNNVSYYIGTKTSPVTQVGSAITYNQGSVGFGSNTLGFGNDSTATNARPMDGYMDDFRLYGSTSDASGVLTQSQLESVRTANIQNVPEPSSIASLAAAVVILGAAFRSRWMA